jgi:hypothetical protein
MADRSVILIGIKPQIYRLGRSSWHRICNAQLKIVPIRNFKINEELGDFFNKPAQERSAGQNRPFWDEKLG